METSNHSISDNTVTDSVTIISTRQEFSRLQSNWERIYDADDEAQIFLSWEWLTQLFERRHEPVFILAFKQSPDNRFYTAFLPLRKAITYDPASRSLQNTLSLAGNHWADYTGILCHSSHEHEAVPALAEALRRCNWGKLNLGCLRISQRRLELFSHSYPTDKYEVDRVASTDNNGTIDLSICPGIELPVTWEAYLQTRVRAKTRQKIRRYERKVQTHNALDIRLSSDDTLDNDLDSFAHLWCQRYRNIKGIGVYRKATIYRTMMAQGYQSGIMQILVLSERGNPVAIQANYIDRRKKQLLFFVTARSEKFSKVPAGLLLHAASIRHGIDTGLRYYDLLRGNEKYKYSLGAQDQHILNIKVKRRHRGPATAFLDEDCADQALELIQKLTPRLRKSRIERLYSQMLESWPNHPAVLQQYSQWLAQSGLPHHAAPIRRYLQFAER